MSEMKLINPDRIKITVSDKKGQKFVSIGHEKVIPEGMDVSLVVDDALVRLNEMLEAQMAKLPEPPAQPAYQPKFQQNQQTGTCPKCSSKLTRGKNGKSDWCYPCWKAKKEAAGGFQQPAPQQPVYGGPENNTEIPF